MKGMADRILDMRDLLKSELVKQGRSSSRGCGDMSFFTSLVRFYS